MSSSFIIHIEYKSNGIHWVIYWESEEKQEQLSEYMYSEMFPQLIYMQPFSPDKESIFVLVVIRSSGVRIRL